MAAFDEFVEKAVKPGPERAIPGCVCVVMSSRDGMFLTNFQRCSLGSGA